MDMDIDRCRNTDTEDVKLIASWLVEILLMTYFLNFTMKYFLSTNFLTEK